MAIDLADEPIATPVAATDVVRFDELAGADLIVAPRERNSRMAFDLAHGAVGQRARVTPFFVFTKAHPGGGRAVRFLGLAVPGGQEVHPSDNLVAVWRTSGALRFQNYRATFTILNEGSITRAWVEELSAGVTPGPSCPARYRKWVETGTYDALEAPRNIQYRTKEQQLPRTTKDAALVERDRIRLEWSLEAKLYALGKQRRSARHRSVDLPTPPPRVRRVRHHLVSVEAGLRRTARDRHPVIVIAARDIADLLRNHGHSTTGRVESWLDARWPIAPRGRAG